MRISDALVIGTVGVRHVLTRRLLRRKLPVAGGLVLNDTCNLHCAHCGVSNRGIPDLTFDEVMVGLARLRELGIRILFIEGGEPFLWHDGDSDVEDVVRSARQMGFRCVLVYTNGTLPIRTAADSVFVSLDGLRETNNRLRGNTYDRILSNIASSSHRNIVINFTVNPRNVDEIEPFCREMGRIRKVRGVFFYFVTPMGDDDLVLSIKERTAVARHLLDLKRRGFAVRNSYAALRRVIHDTWERPSDLCYIFAANRMYRCCRSIGDPRSCDLCGYLGYAELDCLSRGQLGAIMETFTTVARGA